MFKISGYICPFSTDFYKATQDYQKLTDGQKVLVIALSVLNGFATLLLFGVGGYATFKSLVDVFKATKLRPGDNQTADNTNMFAKDLHSQEYKIFLDNPSSISIFKSTFNPKLEELKKYCGTKKEAAITDKLRELGLSEESLEKCEASFYTEELNPNPMLPEDPENEILGFKLSIPNQDFATFPIGNWFPFGWSHLRLIVKNVNSDEPAEVKFNQFLEDLSLTFPVFYEFEAGATAFAKNDGFANYLKETAAWKSKIEGNPDVEYNHLKLIPMKSHCEISFEVYLDENRNIVLDLYDISFSYQATLNDEHWCYPKYHPVKDYKFIGSKDQKLNFDLVWEMLKLKIDETFEDFLHDLLYPDPEKFFNSSIPEIIEQYEFTELDKLLELNGKLTQLNQDKKYTELHDLLNSAAIKKILLKYHPDKVMNNPEKLEIAKNIISLLQAAKKYVGQKI